MGNNIDERVNMASPMRNLESVEHKDLSGANSITYDNPHDALLEASGGDPRKIQNLYHTHRMRRLEEQKAEMLASNFPGIICDPVLQKIQDKTLDPGYQDPRHCLVLWARPPSSIKLLIKKIQEKLLAVAPNIWLMPLDNLHMTAMEISHSRTAEEIAELTQSCFDNINELADYTFRHRARLIKPLLGFDAQGLALSFIPAASEALPERRSKEDDGYTYHHLRRDLYTHLTRAGVSVGSRYTVPSAHLTVARFVTSEDFTEAQPNDKLVSEAKIRRWIAVIEDLNSWLEINYWPGIGDTSIPDGGEWIVGQGKGLDLRQGALWYGGGSTLKLGNGF